MIVKAHSISYRVGPYQLINCGRLAVPLIGKTGPALYFFTFLLPWLTARLTFHQTLNVSVHVCLHAYDH